MNDRKDILWRTYLIYTVVCLFAVGIVVKMAIIQFAEGDEWREQAENLTTSYRSIPAVRGNIYANDGSLLATSIPIYEVRFDPNADAITDEVWEAEIDSLSISLSQLYDGKSPSQWKRELVSARQSGARYKLIARKVRYNQLKRLRSFPLFRKGKYKGGFITIQQNKRERPFRVLAARTIGYDREGILPVGLEGAYCKELAGVDGKQLMQKIANGQYMPITDENAIEPQDGSDIITALDINIQDVAEHALLTQLQEHDADHGCVVVMEVQTGEVKAIANLNRDEEGHYYERYNYAIGESTEPGSTFKLAAIMAAMEDGYVDDDDSVDTENGTTQFYDQTMRDSHYGGYGVISCKRAIEVSSNVGVSKLIWRSYQDNPQQLADRLYKMNLHKPLGIEISGEGRPLVKNTDDNSWSGVTLPWMSIGYEVRQTPLQILTFYNAIANNGRMVKPMFVKEIQYRGNVVKHLEPEILNESICSQETILRAQQMLEGVVESGTARNLKDAHFKIAGKTGTAQIANDKYGYKYDSKVSYQASFVGYFPADAPKYSCIVVVNAPARDVYYGNQVAGPIFKEIADKVYSTSIEIHDELEERGFMAATRLPVSKNGHKADVEQVLAQLNIPTRREGESMWTVSSTGMDTVNLQSRLIKQGLVPNVLGMSVQDAVYILENLGLIVRLTGKGAVKEQSLEPGTMVIKGNKIILELS